MKTVVRLEEAEVVKCDENEDGFLTVELAATRTGVMPYYDWEQDEIIKELKAPEEIFSELTMNSLKGVPVTDTHPPVLVNSENWDEWTKGTTHNDVKQEDDKLVVSETLFDDDLIAYVKSGKKAQVSIGFRCDIDETPGEFEGEEYDRVQRNIVINHVAHVKEGRAGEEVKARVDSKDGRIGHINSPSHKNKEEEDEMSEKLMEYKFKDGTVIEVPEDVLGKLDEMDEEVEPVEVPELKEVQIGDAKIEVVVDGVELLENFLKEHEKTQGKLDSKKTEIQALEDRIENLEDMDVEKVVQDRLDLVGKVKNYVADFNPAGLTEKQIKIEVIKRVDEGFDAEGKADEYVEARFDGALNTMDLMNAGSFGDNSLKFKRKDSASGDKFAEKRKGRKNLRGNR